MNILIVSNTSRIRHSRKNMKELKCELHVVGGALTGLLTAYCASQLNYNIIISEKKNYIKFKKAISDIRTTAIAEGSKTFWSLKALGTYRSLWNQFTILRIDKQLNQNYLLVTPKNSNLGYIVKNSKLIEVLIRLKKRKNISIVEGANFFNKL